MNCLDIRKMYSCIKEFDSAARPETPDGSAPATVADLNNLVTQLSFTLEALVSKLTSK